jgi:hypothetical protein
MDEWFAQNPLMGALGGVIVPRHLDLHAGDHDAQCGRRFTSGTA